MPKILGTVNRVGNFLVKELWRERNYCRQDVDVLLTGMPELAATVQGEGFAQVGTVVYEDTTTPGQWKLLDATFDPATDPIGIIVDERLGDPVIYNTADGQVDVDIKTGTTDNVTLAVLYRGDAIVRKDGLIYPVAQEANMLTGFANSNITVLDSLQGFDNLAVAKDFTAI